MDQTKKVNTKKKIFSSQIKVVISKFLRFFTNSKVKTKKRSSSQKFHEIRCESTKVTKKHLLLANSRAISTNLSVLGLDLHSSSPEPNNFFGAQSSLGGGGTIFVQGAQAAIWGSTAP